MHVNVKYLFWGEYSQLLKLLQKLAAGDDPLKAFNAAADAAVAGAEATRTMLAQVTLKPTLKLFLRLTHSLFTGKSLHKPAV